MSFNYLLRPAVLLFKIAWLVSVYRGSSNHALRTFHVRKGPNAPRQIALYPFHSFLLEVQTNACYKRAAHE